MPGRLVLLATSPRVAPGLLSAEAWSVLHAADVVLVGTHEHPILPALEAVGRAVRVVEAPVGSIPVDVRARTLLLELADTDTGTSTSNGNDPDSRTGGRERSVLWVMSPDGDPGLAEAIAAHALDADRSDVEVELVSGSWDLPGAHVLDLVAVMDRLRSPGGCPWDAQQTHESLVDYLVEEAYETVEAIETGTDAELREELGDLLLQVAFHSRIAHEHDQPWSIDEVADGIVAKLVSRHPHVFAADSAATSATAEQVEENWASLKQAEKRRESVTDGIPLALPALVLAAKLLKRSANLDGVGWVDPEVEDAADRAFDAVDGNDGDLLLALVARMRLAGVDAEQELRSSVRRHRARVRAAEGL